MQQPLFERGGQLTFLDWEGKVDKDHRRLLRWFDQHAGELVSYAELDRPGRKLVHKPKGIWKPANWKYALSVRETLNSTYGDTPIINRSTGEWEYLYHKETNGDARNLGLTNCMRDGVPVGVVIQQTPKPNVTYWVVGLGRITRYDGSWFTIEQWERPVISDFTYVQPELERFVTLQEAFDPRDYDHKREIRVQAMTVRHGQGRFRSQILQAYDHRCAFTGSAAVPALDAAHIVPYGGRQTNHPTNGLLLRADVHKLFDLGLMAVDTSNWTEIVSPELASTEYAELHGKTLLLPRHNSVRPNVEALDMHRQQSGL
jgi:putative restriction endonuclease